MVYYSSYSFAEDLAAFYLPIIHYGKDDLQVILALLGSLTFMYGISTPNNRKAIVRVVGHIQEKVEGSLKTELERSIFESQVRVFAHVA